LYHTAIEELRNNKSNIISNNNAKRNSIVATKSKSPQEVIISPTAVTSNYILDVDRRKIENITEGLSANCFNILYNRILPASRENALSICDYISAMRSEINIVDHYRKDAIILLSSFSIFHHNKKLFKDILREDILAFLDSYRKPESSDPLHRWIGTYNTYRMHLTRFFRWLYYPDVESANRPKPSVIENIPQLKRKEVSIYKPTDLWTEEDDLLFLKYCSSKRVMCCILKKQKKNNNRRRPNYFDKK